MKTHRPILYVLLFAIAGVTLFIWSSWRDNKRFKETQGWINHTNHVIRQLDYVRALITAEESGIRGYTLTNNPSFLWDLPEANKNVIATVDNLNELVSNNPKQKVRAQELKKHILRKTDFHRKLIELDKKSSDSSVILISSLTGKKIMDQINSVISEMRSVESSLLQERIRHNEMVTRESFNTTLILALGVTLFVAIVLIRLNRDISLRQKAESDLQKSEARYRQFVENAGVVTFMTDQSGKFTFISNQVEGLTGFSPEELLGKHFTCLITADYVQVVQQHYYNQFFNRTRQTSLVFSINHKDTSIRWVEQDAVLLTKEGKVRGFQCVVKDVTEKTLTQFRLKEAEEKAREYQNLVQSILNNTPLIIYIKDLQGRYILINKQFKETFNVTESQIIGKTVQELKDGNTSTAEKYVIADQQVIDTLSPVELEDVLHTQRGDRHLLTIKFPIYDHNGDLFGVSGVMTDITEMVANRQELIEARQLAEAAELLQEQFLANMSHEIRTPMNGIIGMANLLMDMPLEKLQKEYVQIIRQSSNNLMVLINDILDLSKIKAGKISLEKIPFDIDSIIQPMIATFELKAAEKNVGFSVSLYPDVPRYLNGDPYRLTQVLNNLLSNAFKFTEKGFVTLEISLDKLQGQQAFVRIKVSDSGIGIKHEQLNYIFESFAQAAADTTRRFGGTGLGLAITKRLIEMQQGTINVVSELNSGTTFTVIIPYVISSEKDVQKTEIPLSDYSRNEEQFRGKHVLIVEDNEVNQKVIQYNLERYKIRVSIASDGSEAVEWLRSNPKVDMILMDLHMPVMDGIQATTCIRKELGLQVPIVILTAAALKNEKQKCLDMGANDYITKPLAQDELERCLLRYLLQRGHVQQAGRQEKNGTHKDFDLTDLLQLQDPESIRIVYDMFEATLPPGLQELKERAINKDWNAVYEQAHKLKGSLGIIQVKELLGNMATIESHAKQKTNLGEILPMIEESISTFHEVLPQIRVAIEEETA
ncbi:MAG: PAS domain S-box protein [Candidatus Pseudobacter hemicellulosilyticus]|uniref:Sensory/regulatory protein RpfC n=1 Tax=Candidatus Pseudobacter hemicellulosilyticus TaxID=3121375 RepID=A0AAJ6BI95_9BACT|nr:MAG: PAS domain S-box protein [Pseudobacter sp.]